MMKAQGAELFAGIVPFVHTAEALSFRRAAETLGVSTAAVSKAVAKLEDGLGVRLLSRTSRRVTLTREGTLFLERCREAVAAVAGARELMDESRRQPAGQVTLSAPFIVASLLAPGVTEVMARYPRLSVRLEFSDRLADLAAGEADVAVRIGELEESSLRARLLYETRWITLAAPSYLARRSPPTRPADLAHHSCIRFVGPNGRARHFTFADGRFVPPLTRLAVDRGEFLITAAEAGVGVCQVLDFMVSDALQQGRLLELLPDFAAAGPPIHALTRAGRAASVNARALVDVLVETFRRQARAANVA